MKLCSRRIFTGERFQSGILEYDRRVLNFTPVRAEELERSIAQPGAGNEERCLDLRDFSVIPGLVDIHTHAAMGADASDGSAEGMVTMSRYYASQGITSWCPTTMTLKEPELTAACRAIRDFTRPSDGAKAAGINLEGPFVCYEKRGAQNADNIHVPDAEMLRRLNDVSGGMVRLVTVAPEEPGGIEFVKEASQVCTVSIGHTIADYDTAVKAYKAGASHATHLFNAMPSLHHRKPGVIGAAFDFGATAELICDGMHVHPSAVRMAFRLFEDRLVLISDSLRCTGMPDGDYPFGGQLITLKEGKAVVKGTDTIAGSVISLMEGVRRAVSFGIPLETAVRAATITPAKVIHMDSAIGSLEEGKAADFVVLNEKLAVHAVYINGKKV